MTGKQRERGIEAIASSLGHSSLGIELKKSAKGAVGVISGIVSIRSYDKTRVELLSHSGRVTVEGERLEISVLENRTLEIYGRITEVKLSYGKA